MMTAIALRGGKEALSLQARREIQSLVGPAPGRFVLELFLAWAVIVGAIAAAVAARNPWVSAAAIFIVATRQNVLALLVHEQAHCLGFRARLGDFFVNCFTAYPFLFFTVEGYARVHLSHHRHFFTEDDPDFLRKSGREWGTPMRVLRFAMLVVSDLIGLNVLKLLKGKKLQSRSTEFKRPTALPRAARIAYVALLFTALTVLGGWKIFLLYWVLPFLTILQVFIRWGALCEHLYNMPGAGVAEASPLILRPRWERLILPNLHFTLHVYHHYFPGIPFSSLPKVHRIFQEEGLVDESQVFRGSWDYFKFLMRGRAPVRVRAQELVTVGNSYE